MRIFVVVMLEVGSYQTRQSKILQHSMELKKIVICRLAFSDILRCEKTKKSIVRHKNNSFFFKMYIVKSLE